MKRRARTERREYGEIGFGDWLQDELDEREITQTELAIRAGVNGGSVNKICRGRHMPSLFMAEALLSALGKRFVIVDAEWKGGRKR